MSFTVRKTQHRKWPVIVKKQDSDDAGEIVDVESKFIAHWAPFTEADIEAAIDAAEKKYPLAKGVAEIPLSITLARNAHIYSKIIVGWGKEVLGEDKQPIPFSPQELAAIVTGADGYQVSQGLNRARFEMLYGAAREKNSPASPAPGENSTTDGATTNLPATSSSSA
ncbi:MAG: hypothetical protein NT159_00525 [Proteobacteria bacterium]|nr:hypothetical protein [Pseudomonadota bacterium]